MKVLKINEDLDFENAFSLEGGKSYVFSDQIAEEVASVGNSNIPNSVQEDIIRFEYMYMEYDGSPLDGKKLFLWRTGGAGDLIFITPVLKYIKEKWPTCHIELACDGRYVDIFRGHQYIDKVHRYPVEVDWLKGADYHLCFEALVEWNPDAKRMTAIDMFFNKFGFKGVPKEKKRPTIHCATKSIEATDKAFEQAGIKPDDFVVGIQYKVDAPIRQYPPILKLEVARDLVLNHDAKIVFIGSKNHVNEIGLAIERGGLRGHAINIPEKLQAWQDSIAAVAKCDLVISDDSATLHIAGAEKTFDEEVKSDYRQNETTPMVGIYGPFLADQRLKYYRNTVGLTADVACSGCNQHGYEPCRLGFPSPCFRHIQPKDIVAAGMRLLNRVKGHKDIRGLASFDLPVDEWTEENKKKLSPLRQILGLIAESPVEVSV